MIKYYFIFLLIFVGFQSCTSEPSPLIPKEKLIEILVDVHVAESAVQSLSLKQKDTMMIKYYKQVMEIHDVSRENFDSSLVLLQQNPEELKETYEQVMELIDTRKSEMTK